MVVAVTTTMEKLLILTMEELLPLALLAIATPTSNKSDGDNEYANPGMEPSIGNMTSTPMNRGVEVVGVGYGRMGTYSLAIALDMLGFPTLVRLMNALDSTPAPS